MKVGLSIYIKFLLSKPFYFFKGRCLFTLTAPTISFFFWLKIQFFIYKLTIKWFCSRSINLLFRTIQKAPMAHRQWSQEQYSLTVNPLYLEINLAFFVRKAIKDLCSRLQVLNFINYSVSYLFFNTYPVNSYLLKMTTFFFLK